MPLCRLLIFRCTWFLPLPLSLLCHFCNACVELHLKKGKITLLNLTSACSHPVESVVSLWWMRSHTNAFLDFGLHFKKIPEGLLEWTVPNEYSCGEVTKVTKVKSGAKECRLQWWWWWWWLFPHLHGYLETVWPFILHLHWFFFKWRLARSH